VVEDVGDPAQDRTVSWSLSKMTTFDLKPNKIICRQKLMTAPTLPSNSSVDQLALIQRQND
jgi:hypothetical protein